MLAAVAAVEVGEAAECGGGGGQAAGRLAHAGCQRPGRVRPRVDLEGAIGGPHGVGKLGVGLEVTGQHAPGRGCRLSAAAEVFA